MSHTWRKTGWKEMENSIPLDKIAIEKIRANFGSSSRVVHLGWKNGECYHYIKHAGYVHIAESTIQYTLKEKIN